MTNFHATILTIFPDMFPGALCMSLAGKALRNKIWSFDTINIRDFGLTKHKNVDDTAYGGGNGLIMRPDVLSAAIEYSFTKNVTKKIYYPSPRGKPYNQEVAQQILTEKNIIILCGRFEGIDERIIEEYNPELISIGDFILSGGEIAAYTILDSVIRLIPGVLDNPDTIKEESFEEHGEGKLLEYPLYTKPNIWRDKKVPEILLSGHHDKIAKWKKEQSLRLTRLYRPDLLK
jgi:tRNA (guanine37-N1)-methyltransferase